MFKFRLKALKTHREFRLREAQAALGAAESARMYIQADIARLKEIIKRESEQFEKEQENGIGAARYLIFKDHFSSLERELLLSYKKLEKASREVERRKQAMIECDKSVTTLESIETKDKQLYKLMQSRKEQKKLDDAAVSKAYRDLTGREEEQ